MLLLLRWRRHNRRWYRKWCPLRCRQSFCPLDWSRRKRLTIRLSLRFTLGLVTTVSRATVYRRCRLRIGIRLGTLGPLSRRCRCSKRLPLLPRRFLLHRNQVADVLHLSILELLDTAPKGDDRSVQFPVLQGGDLPEPFLLPLLLCFFPPVQALGVAFLNRSRLGQPLRLR